MPSDISEIQKSILFIFIQSYLFDVINGPIPDSEIANICQISRYLYDKHCRELVDKGFIIHSGRRPSYHKLTEKVVKNID